MMAEKYHYVYLLSSKIEEKYYIGVRSCECKIGDDPYMGSSRVMTKHDKKNCNKIILKRFSTRKEAVKYEIELHQQFNVVVNPLFWNQSKQTSTSFDTTGRVITETERAARSEALKGHTGAKTWLGKTLPAEMRKKISESNKGKPKSIKHRNALKEAHKTRIYSGYDKTVYKFYHTDYGIIECTQYELYKKHPEIKKSNLNKVIKKERKSTAGWSLHE